MTVDARVAAAVVKVGGVEFDSTIYAALVEVRVEQSVHVPNAATLRLLDPDFEIFDSGRFDVGKTVSIAMEAGSGPTTLAEAEITSLTIAPGTAGRHELTVLALDPAHRLSREVKRRTFTELRDSDIASQIASDYKLTSDVDVTSTMYPYLAQAESDYAFLSRRAMLAGCTWWVASGKLYFKKAANTGAGPKLKWGENLNDFRARFTAAESSDEVEVRGWDPDQQRAIVGSATPQRNGIDSVGSTASAASELIKAANTSYPAKRYAGKWAVQDVAEANTVASALARRATAAEVTARGEADGDPKIQAGQRIAVESVGDRLTGSYLLTSVEHILKGSKPYVTRFVAGAAEASQLADLLGQSSQDNTPWGGSQPIIGVVTNIEDAERPGRIKVRFPSFSDDEESEWARVVAPGAGRDRGWQLSAEVGDEVLVVFEHGDLRRPLIVGGLWSKQNPPPIDPATTVKSGHGVAGGFKTRSGHKIEVLEGESEAEQRITIALSDEKTEMVIGVDGVRLTSPADVAITTEGALTIKADKDISLEGKNVSIKATTSVSIEGNEFSAKGNQSASVEGTNALLKGSAAVKVEGGATAEVKAGMVKLN